MTVQLSSSDIQEQRDHSSNQSVTKLIGHGATSPFRSDKVWVVIRGITAVVKGAVGDTRPWTQSLCLLRRWAELEGDGWVGWWWSPSPNQGPAEYEPLYISIKALGGSARSEITMSDTHTGQSVSILVMVSTTGSVQSSMSLEELCQVWENPWLCHSDVIRIISATNF